MLDEIIKKINEDVLEYMKINGITRKEFSEKVGIKYNSFNNMLSKLNKKDSFPTMTTLKKIEQVLKNK
jgi:transcriptional regulator with XRE-family HTH domain